MMKYEIFKDVVENAVLDYLPPEFQNSELYLQRVKKVNGMDYDGLVVRKEDTNVCPVINLTQLYEDYKLSEDIELVTKNAADTVLLAYDVAPENEYQDVLDEGFRQNIIYEISNTKANAQRLAGCPTRQLNDLTVSYNICLSDHDGLSKTIMVNNEIAAALGMSETELFDTAEKNMSRLFEVNVTNLFDYVYGQLKARGMSDEQISDLLGGDASRLSDGYPWIVQNTSNNGATVLLNTEVFKELSDQVEGNLIIIPSSTHEVLAMDARLVPDCDDLSAFIQQTNMDVVSPSERLSNQVYMYDRKEFQSTLPREERHKTISSIIESKYFNPRSHERSDCFSPWLCLSRSVFQSTLPREERQQYCTKNLFIFIQYRQ